MFAPRARKESQPWAAVRKAAARLGRLTALLAAVACGLVAIAGVSPAMAVTMRHSGPASSPAKVPPSIHAVTVDGIPGWQIMLIAAGGAVLAAIATVTADRSCAARRHMTARQMKHPVSAHRGAVPRLFVKQVD